MCHTSCVVPYLGETVLNQVHVSIISVILFASLAHAQTTLQPIGLLPDNSSANLVDMSTDGSTLVTSSSGIAYKWRDGSWSALNTTPLNLLSVKGVSGDGSTVIARYSGNSSFGSSAIAWRSDMGPGFQVI